MSWWQQYARELTSPQWSAALTQSIMGAGLALAGAWLLFRRQIGHDRELLTRQLQADRDARTAERRMASAESLGKSLLDVVAITDNWTGSDWYGQLTSENPKAKIMRHVPGTGQMSAAEDAAHVVLPDLDNAISALIFERAQRWRAAVTALAAHVEDIGEDNIRTGDVGIAGASFLHSNKMRIEGLGLSLCRWDGVGKPPGLAALGDWMPLEKGSALRDRLYEKARAEFDRTQGEARKRLAGRVLGKPLAGASERKGPAGDSVA